MEIGPFKPVLTALALPPASPLLVAAFGLLLIVLRARRTGIFIALTGIASLWLLSCSAVSVWLAAQLLPHYPPQSAATLKSAGAQAIVVLGGGIIADMPEYGAPQPNGFTLPRLRYGVRLARESGLPLAYSGGVGWGSKDETPPPPEGEVVQRVLLQDWQQPLRWVENRARDTHENAQFLAPMLLADGVRRIALVTSYPHMPRSVLEFERAGFDVIPAPTGYYTPWKGNWLAWLPSASGLGASWYVLRERLGLAVAKARDSAAPSSAPSTAQPPASTGAASQSEPAPAPPR